jgi:hypothetical protein
MSRKPDKASAKCTGRRRGRSGRARLATRAPKKDKAEHRPAAVDALDGEIASGIEPILVGQREEMRARRYRRQSGQHHGKKAPGKPVHGQSTCPLFPDFAQNLTAFRSQSFDATSPGGRYRGRYRRSLAVTLIPLQIFPFTYNTHPPPSFTEASDGRVL